MWLINHTEPNLFFLAFVVYKPTQVAGNAARLGDFRTFSLGLARPLGELRGFSVLHANFGL